MTNHATGERTASIVERVLLNHDTAATDVAGVVAHITAADRAAALNLLRSLDNGAAPADVAAELASTIAAVFNVWRDDDTDSPLPHPYGDGPWRLYPADPGQTAHRDPTDWEADQESRPIATVHVAIIEHKSGSNVSTHLTAASARNEIARFAAAWWDSRNGAMPDDQDELIDAYFGDHEYEWWSIVETPIEP
ncbi:hypothetical protein [Prescottella subtropica]|uniref:hypothetical protein n=1 Tax=Prescottella subtropica TaxID=2545757 RepID=UPI0010F4B3F5|nr:hypothetical protein [Prescottella subtropica]